MNMIEKVARAICVIRGWDPNQDGVILSNERHLPVRIGTVLDIKCWQLAEDEARAAIDAMRDPTDAMKKVGGHPLLVSHSWSSNGEHIDAESAGDVYQAMIAAALNEAKQPEPA